MLRVCQTLFGEAQEVEEEGKRRRLFPMASERCKRRRHYYRCHAAGSHSGILFVGLCAVRVKGGGTKGQSGGVL